jgi:hypothetical protein
LVGANPDGDARPHPGDTPPPGLPAAKPDPFTDLNRPRLSQDFADSVGVKRLLTTVPVRKPLGQDFVRVHPSETYRLKTAAMGVNS